MAAKLARPEPEAPALRAGDAQVLGLIPPGARVLDLGCGSGRLLTELRRRGHARLVGVEVAQTNIVAAAMRGVDVIDHDLNRGLDAFADGQFDVVVLSATLQAVVELTRLLDETLRVGRRVVIRFANFAHRSLREAYARDGRSPRSAVAGGAYDYDWFDTPNRRFPSIADVESLLADRGATVREAVYLDTSEAGAGGTAGGGAGGGGRRVAADDDPNLNADTAVLVVSR